MPDSRLPMLNLTRQFAIVGAIVVALATAVLVYSYRHLSSSSLISEAERNNTVLTQLIAKQIWNTLPNYGERFHGLTGEMIGRHMETQAVDGILRDLIAGTPILKFKIYDLDGTVIYSSQYSQIGDDKSLNPRFRAARHRGHITSELVFRERLETYDDIETPHDIVTTYLPVYDHSGDLRAVFELYANITPLAIDIRNQGWKLALGFLLASATIYLILLFAVSRWDRTLRGQYATVQRSEGKIRQQNDALEAAIKNLEDNMEALRQSEDRLTAAFHISPDLVAITDPETGEHLDVNDAWLKTMGWQREEVIGKTASELGVWETEHERTRMIAAFGDDNFIRNHETRLIARNGTSRDVLISGEMIQINGRQSMMLFAHDITESKRASALLEHTQDMAKIYYWRWSFDKNTLTDTSVNYGDLYDMPLANAPVTHDDMLKYIHPDDRDRVAAEFKATVEEGHDLNIDFRIITANETLKYVYEFGQIEYDATGKAIGQTGYVQDVTALKEAEGASRAKSEFLAHMSHELRTPLNAILGFSESMISEIMGPIRNDIYTDYIQNIHTSGRHLLDLINDILDVSAIEAGRGELYLQDISLNETIASCLKLVRHKAREKKIALNETVPSQTIHISADERRVKQIILNVVGNAIKFTPKGGTVTIDVAPAADGGADIIVTDTGPGMSQEDAKIAMTAFGRASSVRSQKEEGTGLGLPLSKALTELHGGKFDLETAPGKGVSITIHLPGARVEAAKEQA